MLNRLRKIREARTHSAAVTARVVPPGIHFQKFTLARALWFAGAVALLLLSTRVPQWLNLIMLLTAFTITVAASLMPWIPLTEWKKAAKDELGDDYHG